MYTLRFLSVLSIHTYRFCSGHTPVKLFEFDKSGNAHEKDISRSLSCIYVMSLVSFSNNITSQLR